MHFFLELQTCSDLFGIQKRLKIKLRSFNKTLELIVIKAKQFK